MKVVFFPKFSIIIYYFQELPAPIIDDPGPPPDDATIQSDEQMKIAWRYQHLPKYQVINELFLFP